MQSLIYSVHPHSKNPLSPSHSKNPLSPSHSKNPLSPSHSKNPLSPSHSKNQLEKILSFSLKKSTRKNSLLLTQKINSKKFSPSPKMMKFLTISIVFYLAYQCMNHVQFVSSLVGSLGRLVILCWFSWQAGSYLYKGHIVHRTFAKVSPIGKTILVTGCDSGLGQHYVWRLNSYGFRVIATCLQPDGSGAQGLRDKCSNRDKLHIIQMDVTSDADVSSSVIQVKGILRETHSQLFGIVNNAGVGPSAPFEWADIRTYGIKTFDVNVFGMVRVTKAFLPLLRACSNKDSSSKSSSACPGRIINIASLAGREGMYHQSYYCGSKAAVIAVTKAIKREVRMFGIKVITIEPYFFKTPLTSFDTVRTSLFNGWHSATEEVKASYGRQYFKNWLSFYYFFASFMSTDYSHCHEAVLESLTVADPEDGYTAIPPIERLLVWFCLTCLPLDVHESVYGRVEWLIHHFTQRTSSYDTFDTDYENMTPVMTPTNGNVNDKTTIEITRQDSNRNIVTSG